GPNGKRSLVCGSGRRDVGPSGSPPGPSPVHEFGKLRPEDLRAISVAARDGVSGRSSGPPSGGDGVDCRRPESDDEHYEVRIYAPWPPTRGPASWVPASPLSITQIRANREKRDVASMFASLCRIRPTRTATEVWRPEMSPAP